MRTKEKSLLKLIFKCEQGEKKSSGYHLTKFVLIVDPLILVLSDK